MVKPIRCGVWLLVLTIGCGSPVPVIEPGDVVRPDVTLTPPAPWRAGARVTVDVMLSVERPGGHPPRHLRDDEVAAGSVGIVRICFWDGDRRLGDWLDVPLARQC